MVEINKNQYTCHSGYVGLPALRSPVAPIAARILSSNAGERGPRECRMWELPWPQQLNNRMSINSIFAHIQILTVIAQNLIGWPDLRVASVGTQKWKKESHQTYFISTAGNYKLPP